MKKKQLVLIEWIDSHATAGWHDDEPAKEPVHCQSVGWLVYDGQKVKTIAPHITDDDPPQRCGEMTIPTCSVVKVKRLVVYQY